MPRPGIRWRALINLSPADDATIVATSDQILQDVGSMQNAFYERNLHGLQRMSESLAKWNAGHDHDAAAKQIRNTLQGVCTALPANDAQKESCNALLDPAKTQPA